jgi:hypothetical protein
MALRQSEWQTKEVDGLPLVFSPLLSQHSKLKHAFSTRLGGSTKAPMDSFNVGRLVDSKTCREDLINNRRKLCSVMNLDAQSLVVPDMTHSNIVLFVEEFKSTRPKADGVATATFGLPILLTFADCVPIIIYDPVKHFLTVIHAGWRGTATRIVQEGVKLLEGRGSKPADLVAAIGPAIGSCCYPTGLEAASQLVISLLNGSGKFDLDKEPDHDAILSAIGSAQLEDLFVLKDDRFHPELKAINALQLLQAGVGQIDVTNLCTACRPELFYSHRQSQGLGGRQAAIASLG